MTRKLLAVAIFIAAAHAHAAVTNLKTQKTWTGRMPLVIQPLMQSSVAKAEDWPRVWATCQMKGSPANVNFDKSIVLIVVRRSNTVKFSKIKLDNGNITTAVSVTPDAADHYTCAMALVDRKGVTTVNGAPLGK